VFNFGRNGWDQNEHSLIVCNYYFWKACNIYTNGFNYGILCDYRRRDSGLIMQITFRNDDEKLHFIQYLEKFEIDNGLPAWDLIAIFQAYEAALSENKRLIERLSKAITYTSVALSTLECR
jgi:hypothetical protein